MKLLFDKAQWMMSADGAYLMIRTNRRDATAFCDEMKEGKVYEADIKEHRKKRSLDANAYAWLLIGKLANKVGLPKEEVYREFIKDVGGNYEIFPIRNDAVEKWIFNWRQRGVGWVCDILGESKLDGYTNVISYYGSSSYDSLQMSKLINLIQEDCKQCGIEVMTPEELALLMDGWAS
ncbi:MAG: hypothetical protein E7534_03365 [Ruminococcaceae bacterium]|nr:hypothetical protein [Oscillospiraceae bacterium]